MGLFGTNRLSMLYLFLFESLNSINQNVNEKGTAPELHMPMYPTVQCFPIRGLIRVGSQSQFNLLWNQQKTTPVICHISSLQKICFCKIQKKNLKAFAHHNWNCKKSSYHPYTLQLFFTTAMIFPTVLYMDNNFHNDFFRKIVVKIVVVCKGLYTLISPVVFQSFILVSVKTEIVYTCFFVIGLPPHN